MPPQLSMAPCAESPHLGTRGPPELTRRNGGRAAAIMGGLLLSRALLTMLVAPSASTNVSRTSFMENVAARRERREPKKNKIR